MQVGVSLSEFFWCRFGWQWQIFAWRIWQAHPGEQQWTWLVDPKRKGCSRKRCFFGLVYPEIRLFGDRVKLQVKHLAFRGVWCVLNCPGKAEGQIYAHPWRCSCWCEPERILLVQIWVVVANIRMKNLESRSRWTAMDNGHGLVDLHRKGCSRKRCFLA